MTEVSVKLSSHKTNQIGQSARDEALVDTAEQHSTTLAALYSRYVDRVYRYILINVRDTQVAQDLTSETFLAVLERLHSFRGEGTLAAWMLGIARHKIGDYFRSRRNHLPLDAASSATSTDPSPAELAERQWQLEQVTRALRTLAPDRADALTLHIFAGLSIQEVSKVLGKSEAAVRMLISRAVQDLRTRLALEERGQKDEQK